MFVRRRWLTEEQSRNLPPDKLEKIKEEIADVMIFLTNLADRIGIDPLEAAKDKIAVQTYQNKNYCLKAVRDMDFDKFYQQEKI